MKFEKSDRQFLTSRELELLATTNFRSESLERVKDMFLFACYTGLSYIDLRELTEDHLVKGMDGKDWISTKREKTQQSVKIPLLQAADAIIKKYQHQNVSISDAIFPVISNQKMNKYLKEMGIPG